MRKNIKDKLIDAFYTQPEQWIHLRALARKTKASPNSLKPYLKQLVKQKIIEKRKKEKRIQYRPKLESAEYLWHKRVHNLKKIYESGIIKTLEDYEEEARIEKGFTSTRNSFLKLSTTEDFHIPLISFFKRRGSMMIHQ